MYEYLPLKLSMLATPLQTFDGFNHFSQSTWSWLNMIGWKD